MNTQMKKEMEGREQKENIIKNELLPQIKELAITNVADLKSKQITDLAKEMDDFEENSQNLAKKLTRIQDHNQKLKEALPDIDAQIKLMKEELEMMDQLEPTAEMIKDEVFKPKSELDA